MGAEVYTSGNQVAHPDHPLHLLAQRSIALLIRSRPPNGEPYFGCFSGGKDSIVIKELARLAGVPVAWHYHVTTIDPPELVYYIREHHPDVSWDKPRHGNFFRRVEHKGPPTRWSRWCCDEYKEILGPKGCTKIIGVRAAESSARASRYTTCTMGGAAGRTSVFPIRLWSDEHVWQFIRHQNLPYCSLYDEGQTRIGCVGCPLPGPGTVQREFERWPGYAKQWRKASIRYHEGLRDRLRRDGQPYKMYAMFESGEDLWDWWRSGLAYKKWLKKREQLELGLKTEVE